MTFRDRRDAGDRLAERLELWQKTDPLVLAIPKGGIEIGARISSQLNARFSVLVTRKLPFPDNPESGFGAVAEDGSIFIYPGARSRLKEGTVDRIMQEQLGEIERRKQLLRGGGPLPSVSGKTVILTDDGIAMGSTMRASIQCCRKLKAAAVVVAAPVAGRRTIEQITPLVDHLMILTVPFDFYAVAQVYENWHDVSDQEAVDLLKRQGIL
jgi:predicted phosphoribosyltransferase